MDMQEKRAGKKKISWKVGVPGLLITAAVLLNLLGWVSTPFCNWYVTYIFPIWVATYGRFMGLFPFSVGEGMLYLAVLLLMVLVLWSMAELLRFTTGRSKGRKCYKRYCLFILWVFGIVCMIMTLNCFLLYHVSPMKERYDFLSEKEEREYGLAEIEILRNYIVEEANALAPVMKRDENGNLIYEQDMKKEAKKQMQKLGDTFENLKGYYPNPKPLYTSDFFSQQYIMGYYFPFSLEANYNDRMCIINLPTTMCHELSHLKGFILEDEANFIGYLACMNSEDAFFRYSACLSVIYYLDNDFFAAAGEDAAYYLAQPVISEQVQSDKQFLTKEAWEEVEEGAVLDTDFVEAASDAFTETTLTLNGVEDGKISYSRVVELMLRYYDGILY